MKKLILLLFFAFSSVVSATTYYVATTGKDSNPGTINQPWATWQKAFLVAEPGDTVYFRGGVYRPAENVYGYSLRIDPPPGGTIGHRGTPGKPICYFNYPGETPILDYSLHYPTGTFNTGLSMVNCSFLRFKGLTIRNIYQFTEGIAAAGIIATGCDNLSFENMTIHDVSGRAIGYFGGYTPKLFFPGVMVDSVQFINCDSYNVCDSLCQTPGEIPCGAALGGSADGFKYDNSWDSYVLIEGCRAWNCSDDGFDFSGAGLRDFHDCWAYNIGHLAGDGYGWKCTGPWIGSGPDRGVLTLQIRNCISAYCSAWGFAEQDYYNDYYTNTANIFNNTSYHNRWGYGTCLNAYTNHDNFYRNNIGYANTDYAALMYVCIHDHNSWDASPAVTITDADFISLDYTELIGPRKADNSLPDIDFMKLAPGSDLIDAGIDVGLPYNPPFPDLGAFEYLGTDPNLKKVTNITVTGAGGGKTITTDNGTLQLSAAILPADATNKTVTWSISSGTDKASISSAGLVTARDNGTAIARATAKDGSGVYGTLTITISNQVIPVTGITVTGTGGATTITTDNGTIQLSAAVLPANATNKTVTWSISSGTDKASISLAGLVTALDNGAVTARATANDGSGVYGTLTITISNQVIPVTGITVTGAGGATTITTDNGTLQLSAAILPTNSTNKTVTWSISGGTDKASISSTGLVTALNNGAVTARATANDGSGVYGTLVITISYIVNSPPVIVVNYKSSSYSGFVSEINASGSYDANKDNLTYTWTVVPNDIPVSSTTGSTIKYLGPIVSSNQTVEFTLSISDGKTTQSKVIPIEILPYKPELEVAEISNIEASSFQSPYYPYNIIDGDIGTMWSADGDNQWLIVELKQSFSVQHIKLAFQPGQRKESYFDILGSVDKVSWEPILTKSGSCAFSGDLQVFEFPPSKTGKEFNYIKLIGLGNSTDTWNYISELKIFGYRYRNLPAYENLPVKVYPNPAREFVTIRIDESSLIPDFIKLINLSGKVIIRSEVNPDIREITIPIDFKNGVYVVQLGSGKLTLFTQKLVVSR